MNSKSFFPCCYCWKLVCVLLRTTHGKFDVDIGYSQWINPKNGYEIPYAKSSFWNTKLTGYMQYDVTDRLPLNGQFAYYPMRTTAQYIQKPYWWLDFSIDYYLTPKKNWLLSLGMEDVANTLNYQQTYNYAASTRYRHIKSVTQLVRFRLSWKFSGGKNVDADHKSVSNDIGRLRKDK